MRSKNRTSPAGIFRNDGCSGRGARGAVSKEFVMTRRDCASIVAISFVMLIAVSNWGCGGGSRPQNTFFVNVGSSAQTVDEGRSVSITATLVNDTSGKGVTWSLSGSGCVGTACGALSNQTPTSVTYTAPNQVTANLSVQVVATSVTDSTKSAPVSLTVVPPPSVTTSSLPGISASGIYNTPLQVSGGAPPYSWSISSGALPTGFSLSSDGIISGTSCTGSTSKFTVQVADSATPPLTASAQLSISVTVVPLSIATTSLPDGVIDAIYSQAVQVSGGISPYAWSVASGSLPSWATLNSSTGSITGIPGTAGTANFTLQVAESGCSALTSPTQALSVSVVSQTSANDSELSGHYAFLFNGFDDATKSQVVVAGSFTADGKGDITEGIEDENGPGGAALSVPLTGTYNIGSNNTGALTITTSSGSKTYAVALNSISNGVAQKARFIEFDDTTGTNGQRGSGQLRLQDTSAFTLGSIKGPYAFGFSGQDPAGNRAAMVGAFSTDGAGKITSGVADENVAGTATNPSLTGAYTTPTLSDGRASIILNPSSASSLNLTAYVVSAGELLVMRTDTFSSDGLLSGTILSQTSTSFDNKALDSLAVYYQLAALPGSPDASSFAEIGLLAPDGNGGLAVTYDNNTGGTISANQTFTANYAVANTGRVTISGWYGKATAPQRVLYLIDKNNAFFTDTDANAGFGFVEPQAAAPTGGFTNASFSGTFSVGTVASSISANVNATGLVTVDGSGKFSESATASTVSGLFVNQTTTGNYSVSTNGRGTVANFTVTTAGVSGSLVSVLLLLCLLLGRFRSPQSPRKVSRRTLVLFSLVVIAPMLAGCPIGGVNQFVFYQISATKAVMLHEASGFRETPDPTPGITIIEQ
jgi:Putative Ig domain